MRQVYVAKFGAHDERTIELNVRSLRSLRSLRLLRRAFAATGAFAAWHAH
jgi:hypothetical protein